MNLGNFRRVLLSLPGIDEQTQVIDLLSAVRERIESIEWLAAKLRQEKLGLMHDLLTGHVRVPTIDAKIAVNV